MKALAVIGYHHSGKTTTVIALVTALRARGYSVATIKDIHSEKYRADTPGKNSALHIEAGSIQTIARGLYDTAIIYPKQLNLSEMITHINADFLIIEGMKDAAVPKIVCGSEPAQLDELIDDTCIGISSLNAKQRISHLNLPVFNLPEEKDQLCERVLSSAFEILPLAEEECCSRCGGSCFDMAGNIVQGRKERSDCVLDHQNRLMLKVDGKEVVIVPFVQNILKDTIQAIVNNLHNIARDKDIEIQIRH